MSLVKAEHGVLTYQLTEPGMERVSVKSHWVPTMAGHRAWSKSDIGPGDGHPPSPLGNGQEQKL